MDSGDDGEYYYYSDEDAYSSGGEYAAKFGNEVKLDACDAEEKSERVTPMEEKDEGNASNNIVEVDELVRTRASERAQAEVNTDEYVVLTPAMLQAEQDKLVKNVSEVLDIDEDTANVLLLRFEWNKEKLFDAFYANPEAACVKAGATLHNPVIAATMKEGGNDVEMQDEDAMFMCDIMFMEVPFKYTFSMKCGHRYSISAWQYYLKSKIEDGNDCIFATCPCEKCKITVAPSQWQLVLTHPTEEGNTGDFDAVLKRYRRFLARSFVEINRTMRYCPGKNCHSAIKSTGAVTNVKCSDCKSLFCFKCGQEAHAPASCKRVAAWQEKCSNESETANWILANTKQCPKCSSRIEKNQGCNHMTCRVCQHNFCWVCDADWESHNASTGGYYNCNKFKEEVDSNAPMDKAKSAKRQLDRYLHYYMRFAAHEKSGKFAEQQRLNAETRMVEMQTSNSLGWVDVQFLTQAVEQLIKCRRVLKNTYIQAYYLPDGPKKALFEYVQSLLESHTEKLSELSELPLEKMDRAEVINYTRVTDKFLNNLLEQVDSEGIGMDDDHVAVNEQVPENKTERSASSSQVASGKRNKGHPARHKKTLA